jgi:hypothetical protein
MDVKSKGLEWGGCIGQVGAYNRPDAAGANFSSK